MHPPRRELLALGLALILGNAGCGEDYFLMHQEVLIESGKEEFLGGGCESVGANQGGGSAGAFGEFSLEHESTDDGVHVTIRAGGSVRARRFYADNFLATGRKDRILVPVSDTVSLRLTYWGGAECESIDPPP